MASPPTGFRGSYLKEAKTIHLLTVIKSVLILKQEKYVKPFKAIYQNSIDLIDAAAIIQSPFSRIMVKNPLKFRRSKFDLRIVFSKWKHYC